MKNIKLNTWYDYSYSIKNQILLSSHIEAALRNFWIDIFDQLESRVDYAIRIQFKLLTTGGDFRSISYVQTVNRSDLDRLTLIFKEYWQLRADEYHTASVDSILFTYKILVGKEDSKLVQHKKIIASSKNQFKFGGFKLPTTLDITRWAGNVQFNDDYSKATVYINNSPKVYQVSLFENYQVVKLIINNDVLVEFTDTVNNVNDLSTFTRKIKNQIYIFVNGKLVVKQIDKKVNYLKLISTDQAASDNFVTMDLETREIRKMDLKTNKVNTIMEPFCVSIYYVDSDGLERVSSFYLRDYSNSDSMLEAAIESLLTSRLDGYKVYLHNFSNFDAVFLIRILSNLGSKVRPIIRDGRIINIAVDFGVSKYSKTKYTLHFRDSYLLLPASLKDLAVNFNIGTNKGIYPYSFVNNPDVKLNYKGPIPEFKYYDGITIEQYNEIYKSKYLFDLEYETKFYCELDCIVLYKVLKVFSKQIFELFSLDINKYPTLPSLAFAIYRSNFMKDDFRIPLIDGSTYNDLKKAYTGGMVDVYKPTNDANTKVNSYDVNSLYPFSMKEFNIPIGTPKYFEGDISLIDPKAFGIFEVEIETPTDLKYPVLQTKVQTDSGNRTIAPLGNWKGWYLSAEIYNAMEYGYKFKILRGYLFDKGNIFTDFVEFLYNLKFNSKKGTPNYMIAKLILNSLYGKFGTEPEMENHVILNSDKAKEYHNKYVVTNVIDLGNNKELLSYFRPDNKFTENNKPSSKNTSIAVALAITAYARIHMAYLKKLALALGLVIYYMDTDSLALSGKLDDNFIGNELGKLKLEHVFNEVVYLAPKVYAGRTDSYDYIKVKGAKNSVSFEEIKKLLQKDETLEINQEKWYKHIDEGHFSVNKEIYTLMLTDNKRELIFNSEGIFVDTKPYVLSDGKIIRNEV